MVNKGIYNQVSTGLIGAISALSAGMAYGWTSPNIENWLSGEGDIKMTVDMSSWVLTMFAIGSGIPIFLAGFYVDRVGRKILLMLVSPFVIISWIIVIFTRSAEWLYLVRAFQGVAIGMVYLILPIYLVEISENQIRGSMGILLISGYNVGILIEYILGNYLSYNTLAYVNLVVPIVYLFLFFSKPESPYFLVMKKQQAEALKSLAWFRGKEPAEVEEELRAITFSLDNTATDGGYKDLFATYPMQRAMAIVFTVEVVQIFSGNAAILALASFIFAAAGDSVIPSENFPIIVAVVQVCAIFVAGPTVDSLGRRFLLIWSILICGICQACVAVFFYLKTITDVSSYTWTPVVFISIYFFCNAVGTGSMIGLLTAELFPTNLRGVSIQCATLVGLFASIISLKIYEPVAESIGFYWNHLIFVAVCAVGYLVLFIFLPETKGLSFDEIYDRLSQRNKKN